MVVYGKGTQAFAKTVLCSDKPGPKCYEPGAEGWAHASGWRYGREKERTGDGGGGKNQMSPGNDQKRAEMVDGTEGSQAKHGEVTGHSQAKGARL